MGGAPIFRVLRGILLLGPPGDTHKNTTQSFSPESEVNHGSGSVLIMRSYIRVANKGANKVTVTLVITP